jgi:ribosomal protein S27AE
VATEPTASRAWRAACPNCGAPVDFASAGSASAVCSFCQSTLVRDGDALRRIGKVGELFDDHSPLQLGASGKHQGVAFTLIGRLQYGYEGGTWNEWHALFDNAKSAWLSEDNGGYVLAFDVPVQGTLPQPHELVVGSKVVADGRAWDVASLTTAHLIAAQGELPRPPRLQGSFLVADLRNAAAEVATLDYSEAAAPQWAVGRSVALGALALQGLREGSEKTLTGRSLECPSCGNALKLTLASTQSVVCGQCHAVVDVSKGIGADLAHFEQTNAERGGVTPQLPLGLRGVIALGDAQPLPWQVVGYLERCTLASASDDDQYYWREYLLHNPLGGFAFLVDSDEGWSWMKPLTGAPEQRGSQALWAGDTFVKKEAYRATTTWVLGEFYWRVKAGEVVSVADYTGAGRSVGKRLSREAMDREITWSGGSTLEGAVVAKAFNVPGAARSGSSVTSPALGDAASAMAGGLVSGLMVFLALVVLIVLVTRCSRDDCDKVREAFGAASAEYQQCTQRRGGGGVRLQGGSWGGGGSGGHK